MARFLFKIFISAAAIAAVSELGKRNTAVASILAALPLSTIMAVTWLYLDTRDGEKVAALSTGIFWAILPSFIFMLGLPLLLRSGVRFPWAMLGACTLMVLGYGGYVWGLQKLGIRF